MQTANEIVTAIVFICTPNTTLFGLLLQTE